MYYSNEQEYYDAMGAQAEAEMEHNQDAAFAEYEMMNDLPSLPATSIVALFDTNKEQRATFVMGVLKALDNGFIDPLKIHKQIKSMEHIIKMLTDKKEHPVTAASYNKHLMDAVGKQGEKTFEMFNAKWTKTETGTKYDYSKCGDPVILDLLERQKEINELVKERSAFLQAITKPTSILIGDIEDGEMVTIHPPIKTSTSSVSVSLK